MSTSSLFDSLRPASFRGVPFEVESHSETGGRRLAKHEYPLRDIPYAEDLGRKSGAWNVEAFLVHHRGFNVPQRRDALRDALNAAGPGTLIHPWLGELQVCVENFSLQETNREGGYAKFTVSFVEAGVNANPQAAPDTAAAAAGAAGALGGTLKNALSNALSSVNELCSTITEAFELVQNITTLPQRLIADALKVVDQVTKTPLEMAGKVFAIVEWGMGLASGKAFSSLFPASALASLGISLPEFGAGGKKGKAQAAGHNQAQGLSSAVSALLGGFSASAGSAASGSCGNSDSSASGVSGTLAVRQLVASALICGATRAVAKTTFATADDAIAARDEITDALDTLIDSAPDDLYPALADLRVAVIRDLNTRGAKLPRLTRVTLPGTVPALAAAYRVYGDATRDTDIISRNHIRHPGRVPGGTPLEVLLS